MAKALETPVKGKPGKGSRVQGEWARSRVPSSGSAPAATLLTRDAPAGGCPVLNLPALTDTRPEQNPPPPSVLAQHRTKPPAASGSGPSAAQTRLPRQQPEPRASPPLCLGKRGAGQQNSPFLVQEAPVREERGAGWSSASSDSDPGLRVSGPARRKEEPVGPFSVSDAEEFGRLSPDFSDLTVYNEIAQKSPHVQPKAASRREPTPGSEAGRRQEACSRPLFSELRQRHQDSGFASPFYLQK